MENEKKKDIFTLWVNSYQSYQQAPPCFKTLRVRITWFNLTSTAPYYILFVS